jgi:hypothetical protein
MAKATHNAPDKSDNSAVSRSVNESELSPMEAAIAVRDSLRGTLLQTVNLIAALKRQEKQSRLVKSTLDSLKQLQSVA